MTTQLETYKTELMTQMQELDKLHEILKGITDLEETSIFQENEIAFRSLKHEIRDQLRTLAHHSFVSTELQEIEMFVRNQLTTDGYIPAISIVERAVEHDVDKPLIDTLLTKLSYADRASGVTGRGWIARNPQKGRKFFNLHDRLIDNEGILTNTQNKA